MLINACGKAHFITLKVCLRTLNVAGGQTFLNDQESHHEPAIGEYKPSMPCCTAVGRPIRLAGAPCQGADAA
ncbi:hypothetical protein EMIT0P218_370016 [Pseudomonas sp. IT-P218]